MKLRGAHDSRPPWLLHSQAAENPPKKTLSFRLTQAFWIKCPLCLRRHEGRVTCGRRYEKSRKQDLELLQSLEEAQAAEQSAGLATWHASEADKFSHVGHVVCATENV